MTSISNLTRLKHGDAVGVGAEDIEEIVARSMVATCVATPDTGVLLANQAAGDLVGCDPASIVGRRLIHVFVHPDDAESVAWVGSMVTDGRTVDVRHRLLTASGEERHVRASISPIMNGPEMRYAVAQYIDESELVVTVREMQRQSERLRTFAESVAHDLRSPIADMATAAGLLRDPDGLGAVEAADLVEMLESSSLEAANLVARTLAAAVSDADHATEPLDLVEVTKRVKALLGPQLAAAGGQIIVAGTARLVHLPEELLREVLLNVCENAIKYRSERPIRVVVKLDAASETLFVIDNGRGMSDEHRRRLFERGYQSDPSNPGTGLGLARVKHLIEGVGGTVTADTSPPGGTIIALHMPGHVGVG